MDPEQPTAPDAGQNSDTGSPQPVGSAAAKGEKSYSGSEVETIVKNRLLSQKAAIEAAQAKERQAAEAAALAEQGQFKALAEQAQTRVRELEPLTTRVSALEAVVTTQVEALRKGLPTDLAALEPAEAPVEAQLAWLLKAQATAAARPVAPGSPRNPPPAGAPTAADQQEANQHAVARSVGSYRM